MEPSHARRAEVSVIVEWKLNKGRYACYLLAKMRRVRCFGERNAAEDVGGGVTTTRLSLSTTDDFSAVPKPMC